MDTLLVFTYRQKFVIIYTTEDMTRAEFKLIHLPIGQQKAIIDSISIEMLESDELPDGLYEFELYHQRRVVKKMPRITKMKRLLEKQKYITFPEVSPNIFTIYSYIDDSESVVSLFDAAEKNSQKKGLGENEISELFDDFRPFLDYYLVEL